jgi:hypothetical protein
MVLVTELEQRKRPQSCCFDDNLRADSLFNELVSETWRAWQQPQQQQRQSNKIATTTTTVCQQRQQQQRQRNARRGGAAGAMLQPSNSLEQPWRTRLNGCPLAPLMLVQPIRCRGCSGPGGLACTRRKLATLLLCREYQKIEGVALISGSYSAGHGGTFAAAARVRGCKFKFLKPRSTCFEFKVSSNWHFHWLVFGKKLKARSGHSVV